MNTTQTDKPPAGHVRLRTISIVATLLVAVSLVVVWIYTRDCLAAARNAGAKGSTAKTNPVRRIHALGRLEPCGTVLTISAPSGNDGATVETLIVDEGRDVNPGDVLAVLDVAERRQAAVDEAAARWNVTVAGLDKIRAGAKSGDINAQTALLRQLEAEQEMTRKEKDRAQQLASKQTLPQEVVDQKQFAFDRAEWECLRARAQLESLREVRQVDLRSQEMEVAVAAASLVRAKAELAAASVRSHAAGRVLKIHTHPGERISDRGILQIGDVAHMQAVAEIFEGDLQLIRKGQTVRIRLSSSGDLLTGQVEQVGTMVARKDILSNDPVSDTDARVVEVRITISPDDIPKVERLSNARIEVDIEIDRVDDTVTNRPGLQP